MKNKINVNISPNPLDLQTLHCSQNDTGERKFYFTLHNNGEVIDTTDISDPIFEPFDVYKGGTEQLLPVNTDDPTTSPIIADIQYPDEEKTEQEFTYRESPTTLDGKALVEKIKGNTIVWNQLTSIRSDSTVENNGITFTVKSTGEVIANGTATARTVLDIATFSTVIDDVIYLSGCPSGGSYATYALIEGYNNFRDLGTGTVGKAGRTTTIIQVTIAVGTVCNNLIFTPQVSNLTKMFGSAKANEIYAMETAQAGSGVAYFRSLFPLPYYQYDAGSLLSFNGTGIKTTGKNLLSYDGSSLPYNANNVSITRNNDVYEVVASGATGYPFARICTIPYLAKGQYTITMLGAESSNTGIAWRLIDRNTSPVKTIVNSSNTSTTFNLTEDVHNVYFEITIDATRLTTGSFDVRFMLAFGTDNNYEPYTTQTTDLPISTYFPTGMKSAGSVYDELTNSKAITRIGEVDLGTLEWTKVGAISMFYAVYQTDGIFHSGNELPNITNARYAICSANTMYANRNGIVTDDVITVNAPFLSPTEQRIIVADTSYNDATTFKNAMNGVYLQYELEEEQVTEFTHASLICEDGESALYHDDDSLVCECTEDFSKDSGFKDCKIKFTNDDEVIYSNKIQLHIERKP